MSDKTPGQTANYIISVFFSIAFKIFIGWLVLMFMVYALLFAEMG